MEKSVEVNELAGALSKLQGKITDAHKDKQGYGYKYADLGSVLEIARPLLVEHGLSVTQLCGDGVANYHTVTNELTQSVSVETVLLHESGQWISSKLVMVVQPMKGMTLAQAAGAVISYARRYSLAALLGIAQVDDDAAAPKQNTSNMKSNVANTSNVHHEHKEMFELLDKVKVAPTEISRWLTHAKVNALTQLSLEDAAKVVALLKKRSEKKTEDVKDAV